jgi:hypothetical protein
MADLLDFDWINSLGQLYTSQYSGTGTWWPVYDIEVQTGLLRIDVCGKLQIMHIDDVMKFKDDGGTEYSCDDFYCDGERAMSTPNKGESK